MDTLLSHLDGEVSPQWIGVLCNIHTVLAYFFPNRWPRVRGRPTETHAYKHTKTFVNQNAHLGHSNITAAAKRI